MKESTFYHAILTEGERKLLLHLGERKFGSPPPTQILAQVQAITDQEEIKRLADRLLGVESWTDLLVAETKPSVKRTRSKKSP